MLLSNPLKFFFFFCSSYEDHSEKTPDPAVTAISGSATGDKKAQ